MKVKRIVGILFLLGIIYTLVFSSYGVVRIIRLKIHIWKTQEEIEIMQARKALLKYEVHLLESDPEYIKRAAREKFGIME